MQSRGPDLEWLTKKIVYGLFIAGDWKLENLETELITFTSIAAMKLPMPMINHSEGLRRIGLSAIDAWWSSVQKRGLIEGPRMKVTGRA